VRTCCRTGSRLFLLLLPPLPALLMQGFTCSTIQVVVKIDICCYGVQILKKLQQNPAAFMSGKIHPDRHEGKISRLAKQNFLEPLRSFAAASQIMGDPSAWNIT